MFDLAEMYAKVIKALSKGQIVEVKLDGISLFYRISGDYLVVSYSLKDDAVWMPLSENFLIKATWKMEFHDSSVLNLKTIKVVYK
jgi:hypothetical protein